MAHRILVTESGRKYKETVWTGGDTPERNSRILTPSILKDYGELCILNYATLFNQQLPNITLDNITEITLNIHKNAQLNAWATIRTSFED